MKIKVGKYPLGCRVVELFLNTKGWNSHFDTANNSGMCEMVIGGDCDNVNDVIVGLMHEAVELAFVELDCRYNKSVNYSNDNGSYAFMLSHNQFAEAIGRAGWFISACINDLKREWKKSK